MTRTVSVNYNACRCILLNSSGSVRFNTTLATTVANGQFVSATATSGETVASPPPTSPAGVLGTAASFAVFSGGTLTATTSNLVGDVGLFPAAVFTNTGNTITGSIHNGGDIAAQADADISTAYTTLGEMAFTTDLTGLDLGGRTLTPGVYRFGAGATLTGILTLDTQGDPNAVFVFQITATLATAAGSSMVFLNGATDSVYWQVGAAVGLGATSSFLGNIVAVGAITVGAGANLPYGRVLSRDGAVTVSTNTVDTTSALPSFPPTPNNTSEFSVALPVPTLAVAPIVSESTFIIVTGTGDTVAFDGVVTLREAILSINGGANINADVMAYGEYGVNDTISFNIPGTGVQTISPATPLPIFLKPVTINGYTQPGSSVSTLIDTDNAVLMIQLNGSSAGLGADGLVLGAGSNGSSISGLVVNGYSGTAILVQSSGNTIAGNFIGTNATGNATVSVTSGFGIAIAGGLNNTIGGTTPAARNVIGGNSDGINLNSGSQNNVIQGNFIGQGADGSTSIGNRFHGVALRGNGGLGVQNNQIGGTVAGAGNTITNNGSAGVAIFGDSQVSPQNSGNPILGNSIYNNGLLNPTNRLGIDLVATGTYPANDGVTPNDSVDGDEDSGPNLLQNFPVLVSAISDTVSTTIVGTLNSRANTTYRIEFFSSSTASATGHGEGETFLGFTDVTTNDTGNVSFNTTLMTAVSNGQFISATATSGETIASPPPTSPAGVLGTAASFAVFSGGTLTATTSNLVGDVGLFPAAVFTNTGNTITGSIHNGGDIAAQADADISTAYTTLGEMAFTTDLTGLDLGGRTLTPGVYRFGAGATLTGILTLDTQGDPNAVFVFQITATLATAAGSSMVFLNGATDSVYWQVGAAVGLGATSSFLGNIVAVGAITVGAGANLPYGRVLSRDGAVTVSTNTVDTTSALPSFPPTPNNTSEFSAVVVNFNPTTPPTITLSVTPATIAEAAGSTTITATLSAVSALPVTVSLVFSGTATDGADYAHSGSQIVIPAGSLTGTLTLSAVPDILSEANESIIVDVNGVLNATESNTQQVTVTITDDDLTPTLSISDFAVLEGNAGTTNAVFTVTLSSPSGQTITVVASSANGSASSPSDYTALTPTTVTFAPGETTKTVTVAVTGDTLQETNETLFVNLTGATNATIADGQGLLTIINDDPVPPSSPTLTISDFAVLEGNSGTTSAVFTITLSTVSALPVTVIATSADGTASSTSDYLPLLPTTLTFLPGETTKTVTVAVNGDLLAEANETLFVNLTGATNSTIADGQGLATIINDDPVPPSSPTLSISDFAVLEGNAGTANAVFTVTLSTVSALPVTVIATSADGTASSSSDYLPLLPTTLTFLPGETTKTITLTVNGDLLAEANETLFVNLTGATNSTIADGQGLATIINDDPVPPTAPTVSITDFAVLEGNSGTTSAVFTITLSTVSALPVTVIATSADGTASSSSDYLPLLPTTLTFLPGETTKTVTLTVNGDLLAEANETLFVNLTGATNSTIADGQGLATIINDDPVPPSSPTLSISDFAILEGNSGTTSAVFTITLSSVSALPVTVIATSADGTASSSSDYLPLLPTTLTFLPGETTKTVTLTVNGDLLAEANETLFVNLTAPTNATITDGQGLATIINDDPVTPSTSTLSVNDVSVLEGNTGTTNAVFTVTLSAVSAETVTVVVSSADVTGMAPTDYLPLLPTTLTFLPGQTSKTVIVAVNGDTTAESDETFAINLTAPINATLNDNQGLGTIINDDSVVTTPTLSINDFAVFEGNSGTTNATFTVTLSAASALPVTVIAGSADDTATNPSDYLVLPPTTLTFLPGETSKTVTVTINGDVLPEANESFFVNLSGATNATITDNQGLGTIIDDDPLAPTFPTLSISDFAVLEGNAGTTNAEFTITLSEVSAQTVTVMASSADGTATTPSDYLPLLATPVTFLPGETTKTVTIAVNGDMVSENNEILFVNLTGATNATIADSQGMATIIDDDPVAPSSPTLSISDFAVLEGNAGTTNAVFTVTLSSVSGQTVTVVASSANGTASTPSDYVPLIPTTLTFLPGETTKTVTVVVNSDLVSEANENFFVNLTEATNSTIADNQGLGTIIDDDPVAPNAPSLSVSDFAVMEGNVGTTNAVFTVTLSDVSAQTVSVVIASVDGTSTSPSDYLPLLPTTLTFLPGETTKTVTIAINGDLVSESNETLFVNLSGANNATIADGQGMATIIDDDPVAPAFPTLSISDFAVLEGNAGTTNAVFTVTLSAVSAQTVTVVASSSNGTASSPLDYLPLLPTTLTFLPGETSKTITVAVNGDVMSEANETFTIDLIAPSNATLADNQGLGTIIDDDPVAPSLPSVSISDFAVLEGNAGTTTAVFTITLSAVSAQTVTVIANSANGTATTPSDYLAPPPTTVTFLPGETTKTVTVTVNGDEVSEATENFLINLTSATNATIADNQGLGTIIDDDLIAPPVPTVSINDFTLVEGSSGTTNAVFTVTLSAVSAQTVTVVATSADGTAMNPSDYIAIVPTTLTFAPGETTKTISVAVNGDLIVEPDETFVINLTTPINATLADNQGLGTITNDDSVVAIPTLSITDVTVLEANSGTTNAVFTVTLSAASLLPVTVIATSADGTATNPTDYIAILPTTLTFAPGETTKTVAVAVNGDLIVESDETFVINLTTPVNATLADNQAIGTITNDDVAIAIPTLSISDVTVLEANTGTTNAVFTVTLSAASALPVTVIASSADGTAINPSDYMAIVPTMLTFAPGETTKTITIAVNGDLIVEPDETFFINLTAQINATLADNQAIGTITNDDAVVATPTLSISDVTVLEANTGTTNAEFTVTLSAASALPVTVIASSADGTATNPSDYMAIVPTTLTFAPGETTKTITIAVNGDLIVEPVETFFINLTAPINATLADSQGLGTITNDDSAGEPNNNSPQFINASPTFSIPEDSPVGTIVGGVTATDSDLPATELTYSIQGGNASGAFAINPTTGQITVANSAALNFEVTPSFSLNVQVTDNGNPTARTANAVVVVNLINVGLTITIPNPVGTYQIGNRVPTLVAPDSTITSDDVAIPNFSNAQLTASISAGRTKGDQMKIVKKGSGANPISTKGRKIFSGSVQIGTFFPAGSTRHPNLVVMLNSQATLEAVNKLLQSVNFRARGNAGMVRTLNVQLTNVGGVNSNTATRDMAVIPK